VSNFLISLVGAHSRPANDVLLDRAVSLARSLKQQEVCVRKQHPWGNVLAFRRRNGSCPDFARSVSGDKWLLVAGTCFSRCGVAADSATALLARYEEIGASALARELEGFFAVVIGDAANRDLLVISDIVGSFHCYWREIEDGFAISGSSLLLGALGPSTPDPVACAEFLGTGVLYEDRTLLREVRKLPPASIVRFGEHHARSVERYWNIGETANSPLSGATAVGALWETLTVAANRIGHRFTRPICDLTGGYDSRAVVAAFAGAGISFSTTVSGPANSGDVVVAAALAKKLGVDHRHVTNDAPVLPVELDHAWRMTDGEYDGVDYARIYRNHDEMRRMADLSVNGSFGEIARGYWWELLFPGVGRSTPLDAMLLAQRRYATGAYDRSLLPAGSGFNLVEHMRAVIERNNRGLEGQANTLQMDNAYLFLRMQRWQGRIASSTNQIWPCLSPFMFTSVLETMLRIVPAQRRRGLIIRQMLSRYSPVLAKHPLEHGYPAVPATPLNFWRFWPLGTHYAGKVSARLGRLLGLSGRRRKTPDQLSTREALWQHDSVATVLDVDRMHLAAIIDRVALRGFLNRSRSGNFAYDGQWARLLTLELTLQALTRSSHAQEGS